MVLDSLEERCLLSGTAFKGGFIPDSQRPAPPPVLLGKPLTGTSAAGSAESITAWQRSQVADRSGPPSWAVHSIAYETGEAASAVAPPTAFEVVRPHDTMSLAQVIEEGDSIRIAGSMRPGDTPDLYVIPGRAVAYQVKLVEVESTGDMTPRISLLDEHGVVVGTWTMPADAYQMTINLQTVDEHSGHEFYLGVAPGDSALGQIPDESASSSYTLLIEPLAASTPTNTPTDGPGESSGSQGLPSPLPNAVPSANPGPAGPPIRVSTIAFLEPPKAAEPAMNIGTETSPAIPSISGFTSGPLPSRLAAPFAGNLGDSEFATEVTRDSRHALLFGLIDAAIEGPPEPEVPLLDSLERVSAVQGPGGVPLFAAVMPQAPAAASESTACEPPSWATAMAVLTESPASTDSVAIEPASRLADNRKPDLAAEQRRRTRPAVFSLGLSVFATLAATLVLPDFAPTVRFRFSNPRVARRPFWLFGRKRDA